MRFVIQFEYLESADIEVMEIRIRDHASRTFVCGERWVEIFEKISIDIPDGELENVDQIIIKEARKILAGYSITRNRQVLMPVPFDI